MSHEPGDVADILIDLAQRETKAFSLHFAKTLVADMKKVARMHKNPMKSAGFKVLKAPDVPSVLIELGYVSSKDDLKQLTSEAWRAKTAGAIGAAIDNFFTHADRRRDRGARHPMTAKPQFEHKNPGLCEGLSGLERLCADAPQTCTMRVVASTCEARGNDVFGFRLMALPDRGRPRRCRSHQNWQMGIPQ